LYTVVAASRRTIALIGAITTAIAGLGCCTSAAIDIVVAAGTVELR
jgi:hypothetical protein